MKFSHFVVLSAVGQADGQRGKASIIGLLRGSGSRKVEYLIRKNDLLGFHGLFGLLNKSDVMEMFAGLLSDDLIEVREERASDGYVYPAVHITSKGEAFLEEYVRYFKIHLDELLAANKHLKELQMSLVGKGGKGRGGSHNISETRRRFPRAYEKWSTEEDRRLQDEFGRGRSVTELAEVFGRKPGAIRSRLVKNGLITGMTTQGA